MMPHLLADVYTDDPSFSYLLQTAYRSQAKSFMSSDRLRQEFGGGTCPFGAFLSKRTGWEPCDNWKVAVGSMIAQIEFGTGFLEGPAEQTGDIVSREHGVTGAWRAARCGVCYRVTGTKSGHFHTREHLKCVEQMLRTGAAAATADAPQQGAAIPCCTRNS